MVVAGSVVAGTVVTLWLAEWALEVLVLWGLVLWVVEVVAAGSVGVAGSVVQLAECQLEVVVLGLHLAVLWLGVQLALLRCPPLVGWRRCCRPRNESLRVHCTPAHIAIEGKGNVLTHV